MIQVSFQSALTTVAGAGGTSTTTVNGYLLDYGTNAALIAVPVGTAGNFKIEVVTYDRLTITDLNANPVSGIGEALPIDLDTNGTTPGSICRAASVSSR